MNVYALFDRKLRQYQPQLVLERNDYGVQRGMADGIKASRESMLSMHPDDFDLYQVGVFDDESGVISPVVPPRMVVNLLELVAVTPSLQKEG